MKKEVFEKIQKLNEYQKAKSTCYKLKKNLDKDIKKIVKRIFEICDNVPKIEEKLSNKETGFPDLFQKIIEIPQEIPGKSIKGKRSLYEKRIKDKEAVLERFSGLYREYKPKVQS